MTVDGKDVVRNAGMAGISILTRFGEFVANAAVPQAARVAARDAVLDTVGVALAGAAEPAAVRVRDLSLIHI